MFKNLFRKPAANRIGHGVLVDYGDPLTFTFDGKEYEAFRGDTIASALLANGVSLVGRSFKYHRTRGIMSAGVEEANALLTVGEGAYTTPNVKATVQEVRNGLTTKSQNRWPNLMFDIGSVNSLVAPFLSGGFYYKTFFFGGLRGWMFYEKFIRKAAGLGTATKENDPEHYEHINYFADVVVVGGGPAGLMAAVEAARRGERVLLVEQNPQFGGQLLIDEPTLDGETSAEWVAAIVAELKSRDNVTLLNRTTAWGYYDGNTLALSERVTDHLDDAPKGWPRERMWRVRAKHVVLATGSIERPVVFQNNDLPGIMSASAIRAYLRLYGVLPGKAVAILTNENSAYETAHAVLDAGGRVSIADVRGRIPASLRDPLEAKGARIFTGVTPIKGEGWFAVSGLQVRDDTGRTFSISCDCVGTCGGWTATSHLAAQAGSRPVWSDQAQSFIPGDARERWVAAGSAMGLSDTAACMATGAEAVVTLLDEGVKSPPSMTSRVPDVSGELESSPPFPVIDMPLERANNAFVDPQNDVTAKDVKLANQEGYVSVEHMKRYTTLGMATDQGKTANINGMALMAKARGLTIPEVGTTTFRAPYTAVSIGGLVGRNTGLHVVPIRRSPLHDWHEAHGAKFIEAGVWHRAHYYPRNSGKSNEESLRDCYIREAAHVREHVGLCDVTTLGKIEVAGPDAADFLDKVYTNTFSTLKVGKARYGIMQREDGTPFDDGTTTRLGDNRYMMTTTTAEAGPVMSWLEYLAEVVWPDTRVHLTSVSDQWGNIAVAGPKSRATLERCVEGLDLSNEGLPFMAVAEATIQGCPVMVYRISFSGELAYEIATPWRFTETVWKALMDAGKSDQIAPYGLEAMGALRVEKGFITHSDMDGRVTLDDLGMGRMGSKKKDFIGKAMMEREGVVHPDRPKLVGIMPVDGSIALAAGAHIIADKSAKTYSHLEPADSLGHVSSTTYSPGLKRNIALGFVRGGYQAHEGETLYAADPVRGKHTAVTVCNPVMFDPKGERTNG